jgi:hypothetical protein
MSNAALAWVNLFDSATITTSSAASTTPATNLQVPHVQRKWRGTAGASETITATFAADQSADTFALFGLGSDLSIASQTVRLQLTTNGGVAGDVYDTTVLSGEVDPLYGYHVHLASSVKSGWRSAKWTLARASATYQEAGRGFISTRTQLTYNFAPGASRGIVDRSKITESYDGQQYVDRRSKYREWDVNFEWVDATQRNSVFEAMDLANGLQTDVLFVSDAASANLGRDSIWGLMKQINPVILPTTLTDLFSRSFSIRERR